MTHERALKALLLLTGTALVFGFWPLATSLLDGVRSTISTGDQMILGIYLPLGIMLLMAVRNPVEHAAGPALAGADVAPSAIAGSRA